MKTRTGHSKPLLRPPPPARIEHDGHSLGFMWMEKLERHAPWTVFEIAVGLILIVAFLANL